MQTGLDVPGNRSQTGQACAPNSGQFCNSVPFPIRLLKCSRSTVYQKGSALADSTESLFCGWTASHATLRMKCLPLLCMAILRASNMTKVTLHAVSCGAGSKAIRTPSVYPVHPMLMCTFGCFPKWNKSTYRLNYQIKFLPGQHVWHPGTPLVLMIAGRNL